MAISDGDLDGCFLTADFAVPAVFETSAGNITVNGYFTGPTDAVEIYDTRIEASKPTFDCQTARAGDIKRGDYVTIGGNRYIAERLINVGTGVTSIFLKVEPNGG